MHTEGVGPSGMRPIPSEDLLKQLKLANIKTRAGRIAYVMMLGREAGVGRVAQGIKNAEGALKWISRVLKERTSEE